MKKLKKERVSLLQKRKEEVENLIDQDYEFEEYDSYLPEKEKDNDLAFYYMMRDIILDLTEIRIKAEITQAELAKRMRKQQEAISRFENYKGQPTMEFLYEYSNALRVQVDIKPDFRYAIESLIPVYEPLKVIKNTEAHKEFDQVIVCDVQGSKITYYVEKNVSNKKSDSRIGSKNEIKHEGYDIQWGLA